MTTVTFAGKTFTMSGAFLTTTPGHFGGLVACAVVDGEVIGPARGLSPADTFRVWRAWEKAVWTAEHPWGWDD